MSIDLPNGDSSNLCVDLPNGDYGALILLVLDKELFVFGILILLFYLELSSVRSVLIIYSCYDYD